MVRTEDMVDSVSIPRRVLRGFRERTVAAKGDYAKFVWEREFQYPGGC